MKKMIKLSTVAVVLLFGACKAPEINLSQDGGQITAVKTNYSDALKNVNTMVAIFNGQAVNVYVNKITDETASGGKLPQNISTIVQSSFNSIGGNIVTMSAINTKSLPKGSVFIIKGAITEFDLIEASGSGVDAAGQGTYNGQQGTVDGGLKRESKITKLAITFNPVNIRSGNFVPRTSTKNKITINQKSSGNELAFSILGSGIGINNALTKAQGIHSSITILIELSVVEVLGRLTKYPYWILTGGTVNQDIVSHLKTRFLRDSLSKKIQKVSYLLSLQNPNVKITGMMNNDLKQAIIQYKSKNGMSANDIIDSQLYMSLIGA
ncbi:MAG: Unknown protein [uncultured Sulfurovum sp.]|uniref:Peptidoglycan binding-like domain-containing protein n=1 Tax=uncultured Sulfurovum sp. TaxID=269237 RepID=A0A6S6TEY6_9BACT|nr:MAG: Unknown protein [uncultured Sulfurovum sp.]